MNLLGYNVFWEYVLMQFWLEFNQRRARSLLIFMSGYIDEWTGEIFNILRISGGDVKIIRHMPVRA